MSETSFPTTVDTQVAEATLAAGTLANVDGASTKHSSIFRKLSSASIALEKRAFGAWVNAAEYTGLDPTGVSDSTAAIHAARDALPANGGTIFLPHGTFKTTGLSFKDKPIRLVGAWGRGQDYSTGDFTRAPTRIKSTTNAAIVTFTETSKTSIEGQHSGIESIGILGSSSGANQHGLVVDNRGFHARNVEVAGCGGDGVQIIDCVSGTFVNVFTLRNGRHGWMLDPTLGTGSGSAVTNTTFISCSGNSNTSNGMRLRGQVWGCVWIGGDVESNTGYGLFLEDDGTNGPRFNRFIGVWDEGNTGGSVRFDDAATTDNYVDYVRYSSGAPSHAATDRNMVSGSNLALSGAAQRRVDRFVACGAKGALTSSDINWLSFRDPDDNDDGVTRHRAIFLTKGETIASDDIITGIQVPQTVVDAINSRNDIGWTSRNAANSGNFRVIRGDSSNSAAIGEDAVAPVKLPTFTTTQRDALTAVNGMLIYNSTIPAVQARVGGAWVSL